MREPCKDPKRLSDILEAINNIFQYVGDDDMAAFIKWKKTLFGKSLRRIFIC